jgi:hypothetical protein
MTINNESAIETAIILLEADVKILKDKERGLLFLMFLGLACGLGAVWSSTLNLTGALLFNFPLAWFYSSSVELDVKRTAIKCLQQELEALRRTD